MQKIFSIDYLKNLLETIKNYTFYISVSSKVQECRDQKDDFLLSLAKDSASDYLITGDKDLLVIKNIGKTAILTIAEFKTIFYKK